LVNKTPLQWEELIKIKGIGNWTIDVYLMFCLQAPDLLPLGDVAVVNTIKELLDIHEKEAMEAYIKNGVRIARWLLFIVLLSQKKK
jgi:DNA-3-methyladenine glycosylase II